ncbi:peptidylprolyl isomerase [Paenibacillus sp. L3-i20]|uniref:foldase protein PrsA n=1 Tax=Paenibacillus sp. L3-i20 TaxID=2905833 RepID=UPI001EE0C608|nr:peptidylprolyl isomerase [Paenibacillus sp. L3-i20]GKU77937.1 hypothetical protein L3i20_v223340 [Paenibacillus sp. L3-i20]
MTNKDSQSNDKQIDNDTANKERTTNEGQHNEETLSEGIEAKHDEAYESKDEPFDDNDDTSESSVKESSGSQYVVSAGAPPAPAKKGGLGWVVLSAVLAVALIVVLIKPPFGDSGKDAVATVNGSKITKNDLYDALVKIYGPASLTNMIEEELVQQEAAAASVELTDQDISEEIEAIKLQFGSDEAFNAKLAESGITIDDLREDVRHYTLIRKILQPKTNVTDDAVKKFFDENKAVLGAAPEQVRASHILVKTKEEADAIIADLKAGADFAETAKTKSTDTNSAVNGGDLNFFGKEGDMVPEFAEAAFALEVGAISGAVKSDFGYHIIKKTDHKAANEPKFEDKKAAIRTVLIGQEVSQLSPAWLEEIKKKAKITNSFDKKEEPAAETEAPAAK